MHPGGSDHRVEKSRHQQAAAANKRYARHGGPKRDKGAHAKQRAPDDQRRNSRFLMQKLNTQGLVGYFLV
jgi:hypothetical protein